jgi:hypothetical protein
MSQPRRPRTRPPSPGETTARNPPTSAWTDCASSASVRTCSSPVRLPPYDRAVRSLTRWSRIEPLLGVAAVVLWAVGFVPWSAGEKQGGEYENAEIVAWFDDARWTIIGGAALYALGTAAFIWFLAVLREALAVGGWADRLARVAFGSAVAAAVLLACSFAPTVAGAGTFQFGDKRGISPDAAEALYALTDGFVVLAEFVVVGLFAAAGLVALRRRVMPGWLAIVTLLIAAVLLALPIGFLGSSSSCRSGRSRRRSFSRGRRPRRQRLLGTLSRACVRSRSGPQPAAARRHVTG